MKPFEGFESDWKWGTSEGSRLFDRLCEREITFREKLQWLEEAETLSLQFRANRERKAHANHATSGNAASPAA